MIKMKKNVCLMRVSTDMQEITSQRVAIEKFIKDNNLVVDEWVEENGISGFKTKPENRDGLMKIKKMALNDEIENLIIFNLDRIGRRMELIAFMALLDECGVKILSVTEGCLNEGNDTDSLINSIKMWVAEYESKKKSKAVKAGKKVTALNGEFLGGVPNFGYKLGNKRLVIDEEESNIVKLLFDTYIKYGSSGVMDLFEEKGIKKRGNNWTRGMIIKTLKNTIYIGNKQSREVNIPHDESLRIVTDEVFYKAQELMKLRTTKGKGNTTKFVNRSDALLEGLLYHKCPDGNIRRIHVDYNYGTCKASKEKRLLYRCSYCKSRRYKDIQKTYGGIKLNNKIEEMIKDVMSKASYEDLDKEFNRFKTQSIQEIRDELKLLEKSFNKKKIALINANNEMEKIFMGDSNVDKEIINNIIIKLKSDMKNIEEIVNFLKNQLDEANMKNINTSVLLDKYKNFEFIYDKATLMEKKTILQEIIDKIIISNEDIEICLNI